VDLPLENGDFPYLVGGLEDEFYDFPYVSWECHHPN
jgi:hypothetical protein